MTWESSGELKAFTQENRDRIPVVSYLNLEPATESDGAQTLAMSGMYLVVLRFDRNKALVRINSRRNQRFGYCRNRPCTFIYL